MRQGGDGGFECITKEVKCCQKGATLVLAQGVAYDSRLHTTRQHTTHNKLVHDMDNELIVPWYLDIAHGQAPVHRLERTDTSERWVGHMNMAKAR